MVSSAAAAAIAALRSTASAQACYSECLAVWSATSFGQPVDSPQDGTAESEHRLLLQIVRRGPVWANALHMVMLEAWLSPQPRPHQPLSTAAYCKLVCGLGLERALAVCITSRPALSAIAGPRLCEAVVAQNDASVAAARVLLPVFAVAARDGSAWPYIEQGCEAWRAAVPGAAALVDDAGVKAMCAEGAARGLAQSPAGPVHTFLAEAQQVFGTPCTTIVAEPIQRSTPRDITRGSSSPSKAPQVDDILTSGRALLSSRSTVRLFSTVVDLVTAWLFPESGEALTSDQCDAAREFVVAAYVGMPAQEQRQLKTTVHYHCRGGKASSPVLPAAAVASALQVVFRQVSAKADSADRTQQSAALAAVGAWAMLAPADTLLWFCDMARSYHRRAGLLQDIMQAITPVHLLTVEMDGATLSLGVQVLRSQMARAADSDDVRGMQAVCQAFMDHGMDARTLTRDVLLHHISPGSAALPAAVAVMASTQCELGDVAVVASLCEVADQGHVLSATFERLEVPFDLVYDVLVGCARNLGSKGAVAVADMIAGCDWSVRMLVRAARGQPVEWPLQATTREQRLRSAVQCLRAARLNDALRDSLATALHSGEGLDLSFGVDRFVLVAALAVLLPSSSSAACARMTSVLLPPGSTSDVASLCTAHSMLIEAMMVVAATAPRASRARGVRNAVLQSQRMVAACNDSAFVVSAFKDACCASSAMGQPWSERASSLALHLVATYGARTPALMDAAREAVADSPGTHLPGMLGRLLGSTPASASAQHTMV